MNKYTLMNKILEEEGTCERFLELETEFAEAQADQYIERMENEDMKNLKNLED